MFFYFTERFVSYPLFRVESEQAIDQVKDFRAGLGFETVLALCKPTLLNEIFAFFDFLRRIGSFSK